MFGNVKKILYTALFMLCATEIYAQVPQGFNFQAVARGADGVPLISQELGVKISILSGSETGDVSYMESHTITTNSIGLIQLIIGQGTAIETTFDGINWSGSDHYVKIEIDPNGGTEYEELGTTQLLAVPYAILAQDVVNGGSGGEVPLNININTANDDTSFVITLEGSDEAKPFQVFSKSTNANRAIWGEAIEEESNENTQRGVLGFANGPGSGGHSGLFGSAVNFGATGGDRIGVYGQAASKAKFNYGVLALAQGDGSGNIVPLGEEVDGDFGSYNIAGGFYSQGNLNGNVGVEAQASGSIGERVDFGLIARAIGSGNSPNVGVRGEANSSPVFNTALEGDASGEGTKNLGLRLNVYNGSSNIGMEVNADTAAIFNGDVIINGNLAYSEAIATSSQTEFFLDTADGDTAFQVTIVGSEGNSAIIGVADTDGANTGVEGKAFSKNGSDAFQVGTYGEVGGEGTGVHIGVFGSAINEGGTGGIRYGLYGQTKSIARENIGSFGIGLGAGDGEIVLEGDEVDGNVGGFNVGSIGFARANLNGNIGVRGRVYGVEGARLNTGVQGFAETAASGANIGVDAFSLNSLKENVAFRGTANGSGVPNIGLRLNVFDGSSNIGMEINADTAAILNGTVNVNGDLNYTGSLNNTSDRNLKKNIQPLRNGLSTIMQLNPTTYNFRGNGDYNGLKLPQGLHYGLIAQEVELVLPSLVKNNTHLYMEMSSGSNGPNTTIEEEVPKTMNYKTMNYTELIPVLIKAVQEQQEEIEKLRTEIEKLKNEK